jgi:asparagine synthase (glutamine-hydrolysing)
VRRTWWHSRARQIHNASIEAVASDHDVAVTHPLQEPAFLSAVIAKAGIVGFATRVEALRDIFGALLPDLVVERRTKATFDNVFWNRHSRDFARAWDGSGLVGLPVHPAVLRTIWSDDTPTHLHTWPLFQAVRRVASGDRTAVQSAVSRPAPRAGTRPTV